MTGRTSSTLTKAAKFSSLEFTRLLKDHGIQVSMDGTGCWRDNVFVERLWKSIRYEEVFCTPTSAAAQPSREWDAT